MSVFKNLKTYIQTDQVFNKMNLINKKLTSKEQEELKMLEKFQKFEEEMKHGLFENNKLNRTKLTAIKQHIEANKHSLMKKLQFLQKSLTSEERRLKSNQKSEHPDYDHFMKKMTQKLECEQTNVLTLLRADR